MNKACICGEGTSEPRLIIIDNIVFDQVIIMKSLDPIRAKKIFIRKKLGHTAVSTIKASSVTL